MSMERGHILLAIERYEARTISLGKAAELAGVPVDKMIALLAGCGVKGNLSKGGFLQGLANLSKVW